MLTDLTERIGYGDGAIVMRYCEVGNEPRRQRNAGGRGFRRLGNYVLIITGEAADLISVIIALRIGDVEEGQNLSGVQFEQVRRSDVTRVGCSQLHAGGHLIN